MSSQRNILKPSPAPWNFSVPSEANPAPPVSEYNLQAILTGGRLLLQTFNATEETERVIGNYIQGSFVPFRDISKSMANNSLCVIFHSFSPDDILSLENENMNYYTVYKLNIEGEKAYFKAIHTTLSEDQQLNERFQHNFHASLPALDSLMILTKSGINKFNINMSSIAHKNSDKYRLWKKENSKWIYEEYDYDNHILWKPILSLNVADRIASGAIESCIQSGFPPITVTVVDPSGEIIVTKRMDGCTKSFPKFAYAKACTAVNFKLSSRAFRDKYTPPGGEHTADKFSMMQSMVVINDGNLAPFPGGIIIRATPEEGGHIMGGVGVSGATSNEDEYCAIAGVRYSGLNCVTDPENHCL